AYVAKEMQRDPHFRMLKIPLLIGGATTSRAHTAVKIAHNYEGPVVYVPDASRSVSVAQALLTPEQREAYINEIALDYERIREQHANRKAVPMLAIAEARKNRTVLAFDGADTPVKPKFIGRRVFKNLALAAIARYIDWGPFFQTWDLAGPYPAILTDEVVGAEATKVFAEGQALLKKLIDGRWLTANGVIAMLPANSVNDDDIELYTDDTRSEVAFTYYGLRQQTVKPVIDGVARPNQCLADFIAPKSSGVADYIGMFAVTTGIGIEKYEKRFEDAHDDYSSIMLKSLADRLAEALAEQLHERVRRDLWGYAAEENLSNEQMIKEEYAGIRPAPGYPACPEHTVKADMFRVLQAEEIGMMLTDSYAMFPGAAVAGFYFGHRQAKYFSVGKIGSDQVEDMVKRRGISREDAERWLAPNL
ncbi:MAG: vitamin B12 dependent-methionine synthase activation domain-containing protein, partial [Janthinobacterium lividum]